MRQKAGTWFWLVSLAGLVLATGAAVPQGAQPPAAYEVELRFTGYSGLATSPDCDARTNPRGYDVLTGIVRGIERSSEPDEGMEYSGTLKRTTAMDYCDVKPAPTEDQVAWCTATLTGSAVMEVEITVHGEAGRGAWVKAKPGIGPVQGLRVGGDCTSAYMQAIRLDYPSGDSGGSPSGQPIEEAVARPPLLAGPLLFEGGLARLRERGNYPANPPLTAWGLRVIRAVP